MKVRSLLFSTLCMLALSAAFISCSDDEEDPWDDNGSKIELPQQRAFILNEGSYQGNNANIAFYAPNSDAKDSKNNFTSNFYFKQNDKKLGDTGQDIIEYEDNIYVTVSTSKLLLKLNAAGVEEARHSFTEEDGNPRYMEAGDGKIYVSLYGGKVACFDAKTLKLEAYVAVGQNPEQMVEEGGKLYVANSGWGEGTTVSVIDLTTFTKDKDIEVVMNPNLLLEANDELYLISWMPNTFQRIKYDGTCENIAEATHFAEQNNIIYLVNSATNWTTHVTVNTFFTYDVKTHKLNNSSFMKDMPAELGSTSIRGISTDENTGDIYVMTYGQGVSNGDVYRFKKDGSFVEKFDCGGINPSKIIFLQ